MKLSDELITQIEKKVELLVSQLDNLKSENELLTNQIKDLEKIINKKNIELESLTKKIETIKISKTIEDGQEKVEVKKKINEILREIDRCVGLLNR